MDCPAVIRTSYGIGVPELRLQQCTAGRVKAAQVGLCRGVVARLLAGRGAGGRGIGIEDAAICRMVDGARKSTERKEGRKCRQHDERFAESRIDRSASKARVMLYSRPRTPPHYVPGPLCGIFHQMPPPSWSRSSVGGDSFPAMEIPNYGQSNCHNGDRPSDSRLRAIHWQVIGTRLLTGRVPDSHSNNGTHHRDLLARVKSKRPSSQPARHDGAVGLPNRACVYRCGVVPSSTVLWYYSTVTAERTGGASGQGCPSSLILVGGADLPLLYSTILFRKEACIGFRGATRSWPTSKDEWLSPILTRAAGTLRWNWPDCHLCEDASIDA